MSTSLRAPVAAGRRIIHLAYGGLGVSAMAVVAMRMAAVNEMNAVAPICLTLLLGIGVAIWHFGRRLIDALRALEETAARSRSQLQAALDNMSQGLVLCDTSANVVAVNNRFVQLMGIRPERVCPGMPVPELIRLQAEAGNMTMEVAELLVNERLNRPPGASGRLVMPFRAGELEVAYQPRPEGGWACTFDDVTARIEAERRLAFLAKHDALTGLPNRALLRERIDAAITAHAEFAVMLLDLDHFKLANDTYGHAVGDALLCAVAERIKSQLRARDTVARLGGDEFVVLMSGPCSRADADRLAARLVCAIGETFPIDGRQLRIGASIGVTFVANSGAVAGSLDTDKLLHQADTALYRAKEGGRRTHNFYEWSPCENLLIGAELEKEDSIRR